AAIGLALITLTQCAPATAASTQTTSANASGGILPLPGAVTIDRLDPGPPVPQRFLGLSFEAAALGQIAGYADRGDLVELLRSLGPGVLRFGGITADENVAF